MAEFQRIDLERDVGQLGPVRFLYAEMSQKHQLPFAIIHYTLHGERPEDEWGLRLDIDKRVFIDHLQDEEAENILREAACGIAEFLGTKMHAQVNP